jgi:hypothetical protein
VAIKFHIIPLMDLALFSLELSKLSEIPWALKTRRDPFHYPGSWGGPHTFYKLPHGMHTPDPHKETPTI